MPQREASTPRGAAQPEGAVVIPHYNDAARLTRCLTALARDPDLGRVEVVVVDNGSTQDLDAARAALPSARFVTETTRGAAAARNRGVAETSAQRLLFLDSDCVPAGDWIAAGLSALERARIVGGAVDLFDETPPPRSGAEAYETVFAFDQKTYVERRGFSVSANLLTWRTVFEQVGGFAPDVSEDIDWCRRVGRMGLSIAYDARVRVVHPTRSDMAALLKKARRTERELFRLSLQERDFGRLRWALRALAVAASPLAQGPRLVLSPRLRGMGERMRGLGALLRLRMARAGWMIRQAMGLPL